MDYLGFAQEILLKALARTSVLSDYLELDKTFGDVELNLPQDELILKNQVRILINDHFFEYFPKLGDKVSHEDLRLISAKVRSEVDISSERSIGDTAHAISTILAAYLPGKSDKPGKD